MNYSTKSYPLPDGGDITQLDLLKYRSVDSLLTDKQLLRLLKGAAGRTNNITATVFDIRDYDESETAITDIIDAFPIIYGSIAEQIKYWLNQVYENKMNGTGSIELNEEEVQNIKLFDFSGESTSGAIGSLKLKSAVAVTLTSTGDVQMSATSGGTYSNTFNLTAGTQTTVFVKMNAVDGEGLIMTSKYKTIDNLGSHAGAAGAPSAAQRVWIVSSGTIPECTVYLDNVSDDCLYISVEGKTTLIGILPVNCEKLRIKDIIWNYENALPSTLTHLWMQGDFVQWIYEGALPTPMIYAYINGNNIEWTYEGELHENLKVLYLIGNSIVWTHEGTLPNNMTNLHVQGTNIEWIYTGILPSNMTYIQITASPKVNWMWEDDPTEPLASYPLSDGGHITSLVISARTSGNEITGTELLRLLKGARGRTNNISAGNFSIWRYDNATPSIEDIDAADPIDVWAIGESYIIDDEVDYQGKIYICIQAHTSTEGLEPDSSSDHWDLVSGTSPEQIKYWLNDVFDNKMTHSTKKISLNGTIVVE